ncbi:MULTISPECIES: COG2958 family protein [Moraxella]|uniref:COG2958 family protein n=1 Tax=Moraxella TaxID=475 RepID=UPI000803AD01|nr:MULTISPECIES: HrgA protein [Moraxella]MBE9578938.1 HrgA protein [Moraxella sp. K1664]MBE9588283.1 HrgA protein [Moraxella sp. K1630]MBE9596410.1 HrgA protein [Moraxella sp. K2450]MDH9218788.1 HrgA protein [Moraxella lacunata]MDI4482964.1 HrgA protein [Moraxella lacunata]
MKTTLNEKVIAFLKQHANQAFTAREIALAITKTYAKDFIDKRQKYPNEKAFIAQMVAEIGSNPKQLLNMSNNINIQDKPRPRIFWYASDVETTDLVSDKLPIQETDNTFKKDIQKSKNTLTEHELYPKLIEFLSTEFGLYCLRIDEKTSKNSHGQNGNQWLHPDIVAMQAIDKSWKKAVQDCVKISGANVRLWSFEVKKELNKSNVRASFFQAVSNSSWANEGYLVASSIAENVSEELRILSDLHGIGVIVLNLDDITESEIVLPAKRKTNIDWQSVNRIVAENRDFERYIKYVSVYYRTGDIFKENWNK